MLQLPNFKKDILLTGAGFTANVGGYLAYEMWSKLFNHPELSDYPNVKKLMRHKKYQFDYEKIYQEVAIDKKTIFSVEKLEIELEEGANLAVMKAMDESLNDLITKVNDHRKYSLSLNIIQLKALIKSFSGNSKTGGLIFTTNQDLFMESLCRQGSQASAHMISHPGLSEYLYGKDLFIPETEKELEKFILNEKFYKPPYLNYCKLHGSFHFKKANSKNHTHITGINKINKIKDEPLLNWYNKIFEAAINRTSVRLLVIGYGFNDEHINKPIRESIRKNGLRLYIIDPRSPANFNEQFIYPKGKGITRLDRQEIWDGVHMYLPYSLKGIFPPIDNLGQETIINKSPSQDLNRIFKFSHFFSDPEVKYNLSQ